MTLHLRLLLATVLLLVAGCGSSAPGGGGSGASPSTSASSPSAAVARTPCAGVTFGAPLAARDQPADVHRYTAEPAMQIDVSRLYRATITTPRGVITLCLEPALAPRTVNNFVVLARNHFYDGLTFHRVVAGFVIQGGDPQGDGTGGPGYRFADEPVKAAYTAGCVAMANAGPDTNGSQFFICTADDGGLQPLYNLFGQVMGGMDVVLATRQGDVMRSVTVSEQG